MTKAERSMPIRRKPRQAEFRDESQLPPVIVIIVDHVDDDGCLICFREIKSDEDETAPASVKILIEAREAARQKPPVGVGDRLLVKIIDLDAVELEAVIIRKINRDRQRVLAIMRIDANRATAEPVDRRSRDHFSVSKSDRGRAQDGDIVWVEPGGKRNRGLKPARVLSIEGNIDTPGAYSLIALASHDIAIEFSEDVVAEAKNVTVPSLETRVDLRGYDLLTIDPSDAKDHDDAVAAWPDDDADNEGGFRVIVAIADVSWFVRPGSRLDQEALRRGNSVYLPDRVVPMLPEHLSNGLCSLREGEDRPCLAVEMILDHSGRMIDHKFSRAMMRSTAKLSYEEAQAIIRGGEGKTDKITAMVGQLHAAYRCRMGEREKRAPLDLELSERKIVLGDDDLVSDVVMRERFDAHKLIEEFMILANVAASETLEKARIEQIYRVHDKPDAEKLEATRLHLQTLDYRLVKGGSLRPGHFNQILKIAGDRDQKEMVSELILRSQRQAVYATENLGHFGLNLARYAHFTSPIRRYADLTIHRALVRACKLGEGGQTQSEADDLEQIAADISQLERRAMLAERETNDRYLSEYLSGRVGAEFSARIRGATRFGLFVMLDQTGADGFIPMRNLPGRNWRFDETQNHLINMQSRSGYQLGQAVTVRLVEATPVAGGLVFDVISKPIKLSRSDRVKVSEFKPGKKGKKTKGKKKPKGSKHKKRSGRPAR